MKTKKEIEIEYIKFLKKIKELNTKSLINPDDVLLNKKYYYISGICHILAWILEDA